MTDIDQPLPEDDAIKAAHPTGRDWTCDKAGRSNSSVEYRCAVAAVGRLIRCSSHALINGDVDGVARLIVSQLAHVHGLAPSDGTTKSEAGKR